MISFLRRHQKSIFVATISVFLSGSFVGLGGFYFTSRDNDGAVARIGSSKIPAQRLLLRVNQYADALRAKGTEVDDAMMSRLKREMLNDMMIEEMMSLKADELGLMVTNDELSRDIRATPAFQRGGQFDQDAYFQQVRAIFRETPQEYERSRRKSIKSGRLKQLIFRMAKVTPAEANAAYVQFMKSAPKKDAAKITKESVAQNLQQQRAVELINHCLKLLSTQVEHQVWMERVEGRGELVSDILVVGSVALDSVKTTVGKSVEALGGSATYFALAASYFTEVALVGVVGEDFPREHRRTLKRRGVDLAGLKAAKGKTFRWSGKYGKDAAVAETLATHLNVFKEFKPVLSESQRKSPVVFLANIDPELQSEVLAQMKAPALVACDTMNYWIDSKPSAIKKLLAKVDVFFSNDQEAMKLTGAPNALQAAEALADWGPSVVVIKKGEHGALMKVGSKFFVFPAYPLARIKDPTGAGDTFAGGFLGYLASSGLYKDVSHLKRAMAYGTTMASFNVQDFSTKNIESLERDVIDERFHDFAERMTVPRADEFLKPRRAVTA